MKLVIQRVKDAKVTVEGAVVGAVKEGLLVLVGIHAKDTLDDIQDLCQRLLRLHIFPHQDCRWGRSLLEDDGQGVLFVSQFTLFAKAAKNGKLDFHEAKDKQTAKSMFDSFVDTVRASLGHHRVATGAFGEYMDVSLTNYGPMTVILESKPHTNVEK